MFKVSKNSAFKSYDFVQHKTEYSDYLDTKYNIGVNFKIKVVNHKLKIINPKNGRKKTILNMNTRNALPFKKTNVRTVKLHKTTFEERFNKIIINHFILNYFNNLNNMNMEMLLKQK